MPRCSSPSTASQVERVLTDNGKAYANSHVYAEAVAAIDARHKRTRAYRPQTNGKAERFIKTLLAEWAYARLYRSSHERLKALPRWIHFYHHDRFHAALDGQVPALVNSVRGNHS